MPNDRPTALELIEAVTEFLSGEVLPALDDHRLRFRTLVALNALGIAYRELDADAAGASDTVSRAQARAPEQGQTPCTGASDTVLRTPEELADLAARIRAGDAPPDALALLKRHVAAKLRVSNPRWLEKYR